MGLHLDKKDNWPGASHRGILKRRTIKKAPPELKHWVVFRVPVWSKPSRYKMSQL